MANIFWYYCVIAIGIALIIFTFMKKKAVAHLFSFFLAISSAAYLAEVVVLFVFRSYDYKPGLFTDPVADSVFGHLVCNGFFWGGFTILMAALRLRFYWAFVFSAFFMLVEVFFLKHNLYVHYWWRLYYTGLGVVVFLPLCKIWLSLLRKNKVRLVRHATFFFISWILLAGPAIVLLITGGQRFESGLSDNLYLNDIYLDVPYHLVLSFVIVCFVNILRMPYFRAAVFIIILLGDAALVYNGVLYFFNGWNLFYLAALRFLTFAFYLTLEKSTLTPDDGGFITMPAF
jgi:hypothetical protein